MLISGSVVRILHAKSRYNRELLFRVAPKSLDASAPPAPEAPAGASDAAYASMRALVVLLDFNVLPSADPRLTYTIEIERPTRTYDPRQLLLTEAEAQRRPRSDRFAASPAGQALVYSLTALVSIDTRRMASTALLVSTVANTLPPTMRRSFSAAASDQLLPRVNGKRARLNARERTRLQTMPSLYAVDVLMSCVSSLPMSARWLVHDTFGESFATRDYFALANRGVATPQSLQRLTASEQVRVHETFLGIEMAENEEHRAWPPWKQVAFARYNDCVALNRMPTRRLLKTPTASLGILRALDSFEAIDSAVNALRSSSSTVMTLDDSAVDSELFTALLDMGVFERGARIAPDAEHAEPRWYVAACRDATNERECARLLTTRSIIDRCLCLTVASGSLDRTVDVIETRIRHILATDVPASVVYVAVTPSHAASYPFDVLSLDDVVARRVTRQSTTVVLVGAHAFGVDSFARVVTALHETAEHRALTLVMVGDPLNANGSPRESDRGCVFRDTVAAIRRGTLASGRVEHLFGTSSDAPCGGVLDADEHALLRRYRDEERSLDESTTNDSSRFAWYETLDGVPIDIRRAGLVLVGTSSAVDAVQRAGSLDDALMLRRWIVFEELGQVAHIASTCRLSHVGALESPPHRVSVELHTRFSPMPLHTRGGFVTIDETLTPSLVDHRRCCFTARPNIASLEMHATTRAVVGAPARFIERVSPGSVADELAFIVTERTGVEDVRAACALVRRRLHIVCGERGRDAFLAATRRHSPRPRSQLVSLLASVADGSAVLAPPALAVDVAANDAHRADANADEAGVIIAVLGSTTMLDSLRASNGVEDAQSRPLVRVDALRAHLDTYLRGGAAAAPDDDDDDGSEAPVVFSPAHVNGEALANVHVDTIDRHVAHRFWALVHEHPLGTLGHDQDADLIAERARTYPPPLPDDSVVRALGRERAFRAREAGIVHMLCMIVKNVAEEWYIEAERRLVASRRSSAVANHHAAAIAQHLQRIAPPPAIVAEDELGECDEYDLLGKMHRLRQYIGTGLGPVQSDSGGGDDGADDDEDS